MIGFQEIRHRIHIDSIGYDYVTTQYPYQLHLYGDTINYSSAQMTESILTLISPHIVSIEFYMFVDMIIC